MITKDPQEGYCWSQAYSAAASAPALQGMSNCARAGADQWACLVGGGQGAVLRAKLFSVDLRSAPGCRRPHERPAHPHRITLAHSPAREVGW